MLRTRRREEMLLNACLQSGQPFVIDNTNPLPADRSRYIGAGARRGVPHRGLFFQRLHCETPCSETICDPGKQKIPAPAVAATFKKLVPPSAEEGFDEIYTVELIPDRGFVVSTTFPAA